MNMTTKGIVTLAGATLLMAAFFSTPGVDDAHALTVGVEGAPEVAFYVEPSFIVETGYHRPLCIEPSPCQTSAECGITIEGYPGVCIQGTCYCP